MSHSSRTLLVCGALLSLPVTGAAQETSQANFVSTRLESFQEVPSVSSSASGGFRATIDDAAGTISYQLSFTGLTGDVRQSHIHFGQHSVNGQVSVFLCQTAANPDPTGLAPQCPQSGTVTGLLQAANMAAGTTAQGIAPGEFAELIAAIRSGVAYVNVHSSTFPGGEIRGQLRGSIR